MKGRFVVWSYVLALGVAGWGGAGGCKNKDASESKAPPKAAGSSTTRDAGAPRVVPQVLWHTPYKGRLHAFAVAKGVVVVASRGRGDRVSARRIAGFSAATGKLLWERHTRLRFYERNVPWSISHALVGDVLAVAKTAHRVEGLNPLDGKRLWQRKATGGVVAAGPRFAVAHHDAVKLLKPSDGSEVLQMTLSDPRSGAPGNGLMNELKNGTMLGAFPGGLLLTRRHGAAVQALSDTALTHRWRFHVPHALPARPDRFVVGRRTLLAPVLYPSREEQTTVAAWKAFGEDAKPLWQTAVPGRASRRLTFVTDKAVVGVSRDRAKRTLLWRIDRATGKLLDARELPQPHFCYQGSGVIACKRRHGLAGHSLDTVGQVWSYAPPSGTVLRSVRYADGLLVAEVGRKLVVLNIGDGRVRFTVNRALGKHPYRVVTVLGSAGGRVLLVARHLEESPWGDRLLLLGLSLADGALALEKRLGRYPRPGARPAPGEPESPEGSLPVLLVRAGNGQPDRVFSLFDKTFQVLDATSGKSLFARGVPGQPGRVTRLLDRAGDLAVFRRGKALFGVSLSGHRLAWRASLWKSDLLLAAPHRAFLKGRKGRLELGPKRAPDPVARGVEAVLAGKCAVRHAEPGRWFCRSPNELLVIGSRTGAVGARLKRPDVVFGDGGLVLALRSASSKSARPDAWVGLDVETGKERWRAEAAVDATERVPLPPPFDRERAHPARWAFAAGGRFLVTGADGRCVRAVDEGTGKAAFTRCFGELGGLPMRLGGAVLLTAREATGAAAGKKGGVTAEQSLYLLELASGRSSRVFDPGPGKRVVRGVVHEGVLYATLRPTKGPWTQNEVVAIRLFAKR